LDELEDQYSKWKGQLNRGLIEFVTLLLLRKERHGYDILQLIRANIPVAEEIADGPIYALLSRLKHRGFLSSKLLQKQGKNRRYFSLTSSGVNLLQKMLQDWEIITSAIGEFQDISES